ncbi:ABC transporter substrate-binding protein [Candidatus Bipolaricaulota bacterium]|nr:ABC transporter substrate-binding protein [Candidatus Bipolaricaulota bacterium]
MKLALAVLLMVFATAAVGQPIVIGITQIVDHLALNAVRDGVIAALSEAGYVEGENVRYILANAQGDFSVAIAIAQDFKARGVDLVVAIATPTALAAVQVFSGTDVPVVYSAITAPEEYGLTGHPNVTGVSDLIEPALDLALLKALSPGIRRVGIVYNPGEANSDYLTKVAQEAANSLGLQIVTAAAESTAMVMLAAQSLIGRVDAFYATTDNTVAAGIEGVVQVANAERIPFLMADPFSIGRGPLVCAGWDYYSHGLLTGKVVLDLLAGKRPNEIPPIYQKDTEFGEREILLNLDTAQAIGFTFPQAVVDQATGILVGGRRFVPGE